MHTHGEWHSIVMRLTRSHLEKADQFLTEPIIIFFSLIYMNKMYIDGTFDERCIVIAQNKQIHCKVAGFVVAACEFHVRKIELLRIV